MKKETRLSRFVQLLKKAYCKEFILFAQIQPSSFRLSSILSILSLFLLFPNINSIAAQNQNSLQMISEIENFEFSKENLRDFQSLLYKYDYQLTYEQKIKYRNFGAETALKYKNDTLYLAFKIEVASMFSSGLYNFETADSLLKVLEPEVVVFNNFNTKGLFYSILGINHQIEGNYVEAIDNYTKSYNCYLKSSVPQKARYLLYNLTAIYFTIGDNENC